MSAQDQQPSEKDAPSSDDFSFHSLMKRAREGDAQAVSDLIERYHKYLLFIANENVDEEVKIKLGASDIVQETMMHAQMNINQFNGSSEAEWKAWLATILSNDLKKGRRQFQAQKRTTDKEINIQEQSAVGRILADRHLTPSSDAIQNEKTAAINAAIGRLKEDQQQAIRLRNFELRSFEEIGSELNMTPDGARKLWARAIESLRESLKTVSPDLGAEEFEQEKTE